MHGPAVIVATSARAIYIAAILSSCSGNGLFIISGDGTTPKWTTMRPIPPASLFRLSSWCRIPGTGKHIYLGTPSSKLMIYCLLAHGTFSRPLWRYVPQAGRIEDLFPFISEISQTVQTWSLPLGHCKSFSDCLYRCLWSHTTGKTGLSTRRSRGMAVFHWYSFL